MTYDVMGGAECTTCTTWPRTPTLYTSQLEDLQEFYDTLETHIRGFASLGKAQESYGDLLIPIIVGKLPNDRCTKELSTRT
jgi:hypothetical protein